jgi:hypothetical protein
MSIDATAYLWNTAIRPVLTYGLQCVNVSKQSLMALEKIQAKLLKSAIGLHTFCRHIPILNALKIHKIETSLDIWCLELLRFVFNVKSRATSFYTHLLNLHVCGSKFNTRCNNLISRAGNICLKRDISFVKYIVDKQYSSLQRSRLKRCFPVNDGYNDTVRQLLLSFNL